MTDQAFRKEGEGVAEAVTPFLFPLYPGKVIVYSLYASCRGRVRMNIVPRSGFHQTDIITKAASPAPNPFLVPHPAFKVVSIFSGLPPSYPPSLPIVRVGWRKRRWKMDIIIKTREEERPVLPSRQILHLPPPLSVSERPPSLPPLSLQITPPFLPPALPSFDVACF